MRKRLFERGTRKILAPAQRPGKLQLPQASKRRAPGAFKRSPGRSLSCGFLRQPFYGLAPLPGGGVAGVVGCVAAGRAGSLPVAGAPGRVGSRLTSFFSPVSFFGAGVVGRGLTSRGGAVRLTGSVL